MNFNAWDSIIYDVIVANAILDRILHHSKLITIKGRTYRIKDYVNHLSRCTFIYKIFVQKTCYFMF
nr:ATP-binding protein [Acetitomaculum ruminis]